MAPGKKKSGKDAASKSGGPAAVLNKLREAKNKGPKHLRKLLDERCSEPNTHYLHKAHKAHLLLNELEEKQRTSKDKKSAQGDLEQALQLLDGLDKPGGQYSTFVTEVKIAALKEQYKETNDPGPLLDYIEEVAARGADLALYVDPKHEHLEELQGTTEELLGASLDRAIALHADHKAGRKNLLNEMKLNNPELMRLAITARVKSLKEKEVSNQCLR